MCDFSPYASTVVCQFEDLGHKMHQPEGNLGIMDQAINQSILLWYTSATKGTGKMDVFANAREN